MRIVFFGTPEFAVPSLEALVAEGAQVVGVVTRPDRPQGRSRSTLVPPPVKVAALRHGLPVTQPERPAGDLFLTTLRQWHPELGVVVAYGHLLREDVLAVPPKGMINVHASLLPRWRGAAPVNQAILEGDGETGVTIMQMDRGMDAGPILHQAAIPIEPGETAGELTTRLARLGADALVEALALMRLGRLAPRPQDPARVTFAPKVDRQSARIPWQEPAAQVARRIRAFDPAPGAWAVFAGQEVKCFGARPLNGAGAPGTVLEAGETLTVAAGEGAVEIARVQPAGKAPMSAGAWSRGRGARVGDRLA